MPNNSSVAQAPIPVDVRRLPAIRRLPADYAYAFEGLRPFFAGNPAEPSAWRAAIDRVQASERPRSAIADAVAAQQRRFGAGDASLAAARQLSDRRTVAVVTGQQAGLFGGPLYTLLKAMTAIKLAAHVQATYGVPAVPVFWIEAEDHDWNEVASCPVLDRDFARRTVTLPALAGSGTLPVGAIRLAGAARSSLDALRDLLAPTEFTGPLLERLAHVYREDFTLVDGFARWMLQTLGEHGIVAYDASDPATKPFVRDLFAHEIRHGGRTSQRARETGESLAGRGYHAQVIPAEDAVALFRLDGGRTPIGDAGKDRAATAVLLKDVAERPATFSPNVLLRPLVQDSLFPTVAYVAGPNELAYLAQLRPIYDDFSVPMPLMYPRASATLLDSAAMKFLSKSGLPFEGLARNDEAALNRLLEQQLPAAVEHAWTELDRSVTTRMEALIEVLPQVDPTLEGAGRSVLGRITHEVETLHGKILHAAKRRDETLRRQFAHARALAFPDGEPQERVVGWVYFLNRYGPSLVERLLADLPLEMGKHWVMGL